MAGYNALTARDISPGQVIAFISYINMLIRPLRQIADRFNNIQRGLVGAERVLGIMDEETRCRISEPSKKDHIEGKIEFQNVKIFL